ncbi:MAG: phosphoribosylanthranilate isomerase [Gemmatimonadaceae bacterium]
MTAQIKFCGMTRAADARLAAELGAAFIGAVFAGGPRTVTAEHAREMFVALQGVRRVGVFGHQTPDEIAETARVADLHVVQLHADPSPEFAADVKRETGLETWVAMRIGNAFDRTVFDELSSCADALLLDSRSPGPLGGSGQAFDWSLLADVRDDVRPSGVRIVLAGGLTPPVAARAIAEVRPDIVDVSSGIEASPGIKDPDLMRAFVTAVRSAG